MGGLLIGVTLFYASVSDFPEMSVTSVSELKFLFSQETYTPGDPPVNLVGDTLHVKSVSYILSGYYQIKHTKAKYYT